MFNIIGKEITDIGWILILFLAILAVILFIVLFGIKPKFDQIVGGISLPGV